MARADQTVGQLIARGLAAAGVDWAFTVPGESFLGVLDELPDSVLVDDQNFTGVVLVQALQRTDRRDRHRVVFPWTGPPTPQQIVPGRSGSHPGQQKDQSEDPQLFRASGEQSHRAIRESRGSFRSMPQSKGAQAQRKDRNDKQVNPPAQPVRWRRCVRLADNRGNVFR